MQSTWNGVQVLRTWDLATMVRTSDEGCLVDMVGFIRDVSIGVEIPMVFLETTLASLLGHLYMYLGSHEVLDDMSATVVSVHR